MARRGRKRQPDAESLYWQLILSGLGTVAACKEVGIGRKTGYRWSAENGGLPPDRLAEDVRSGRYLSLLERQRIATLHRDGLGVRAIADRIGRAGSTVSRELHRNTRPHDRGRYGRRPDHRPVQQVRRRHPGRPPDHEQIGESEEHEWRG